MGVKNPIYVVAGATACSSPMIPGILDGSIAAATAAERFLVALVVCWILGSILGDVYSRYSTQVQRNQILRLIDAEHDTTRDVPTVEIVSNPED